MGNQVAHQDGHDVLVHGYHFGHYSNLTYSVRYLIDGSGGMPYSRLMIKGIKFSSIPVSDQGPALAFYTEKLGFRILTDQPFDGKQRWIELSIPGAETGVVLFTAEAHKDRIGTFSGISLDLQKTYEELLGRGVEFAGPPQKQPWGSFVILKDPDGNQFVLSAR